MTEDQKDLLEEARDLEAFELRHKGDYGLRHAIAYDQAQEQIARARGFLELAEKLIGSLPPMNKERS